MSSSSPAAAVAAWQRGHRRQRDSVEPLQPGEALERVAAQREVQPDVPAELGRLVEQVGLQEPQVGRAQVGVVGLEKVQRVPL